MVVSEAKYEELKSLYQAEVRKRLDREADLRHAEEALEKVTAERDDLLVKVGNLEEAQRVSRDVRESLAQERGRANDARDAAVQEANYLRKRCQEAEERAVQLQEQIKVQEEVIERLKAQNARFVEEQREAKKRADATAVNLIKTEDEVARLVGACNAFKEQLARVTKEKNDIVEISNGFARERDAIQADYDARGRVIKKLRKRLHKLKKKLKQ